MDGGPSGGGNKCGSRQTTGGGSNKWGGETCKLWHEWGAQATVYRGGQRWPFRGRDDQLGSEQECEERGAATVAINARQVATIVAMDTGRAAAAAMDAGRVAVVE